MIEIMTVLLIIASIVIVGLITILAFYIADTIMEAVTGTSFTDAFWDFYHEVMGENKDEK